MDIVFLGIITFLVSSISTIVGFGTGTIMVPILLSFLPLEETYLFVTVLQWFSGLWKVFLFGGKIKWPLVVRFGIPAIIGTVAGSILLFYLPKELLLRIFGGLLIGYAGFLIVNPDFVIEEGFWQQVVGGLSLGFLGGLFSIRGPIRSGFLSAFDLSKTTYIATSGAIGLLLDTVRIGIYFAGGMRLDEWLLSTLLILVPLSFLAAFYSRKIVKKIPQEKFRFVVAAVLALAGVRLMLFG